MTGLPVRGNRPAGAGYVGFTGFAGYRSSHGIDPDPMAWAAVRRNGTEIKVLVALDLEALRGKIAVVEGGQA